MANGIHRFLRFKMKHLLKNYNVVAQLHSNFSHKKVNTIFVYVILDFYVE